MTRDAMTQYLAFALILSVLANGALAVALLLVTYLSPHADRSWLPARLRKPPQLMRGS